jgi:sorting nexin-29
VFHKIFKKIWEKEEIPRDWKEGILFKVPKKGDLTECANWRRITLLNTNSKLLTRIMLERMKKETDKKLRENQAGFRAKRSCTDHITTLRIIIEQSTEWNSGLYLNFIDYKQDFDTLNRMKLRELMVKHGFPTTHYRGIL